MSRASCEIDGSSIVFLGDLNPAIFQPRWLEIHKLIRPEEAESADISVVSKQISDFRIEWLHLQVTQDRFVAEINDPAHQSPLRDLVVGVFTLLEHTPIIAMGLNRSMHWRMPSEDDWHALGHLLAPKKIWSDLIEQPGMKSLTMEGKSKRIASTVVRLKIEPSVKVRPGVFVESNAHYDFPEEKKFSSPVAILSADWDQSQIFAKESAERLLAQE